MDFKLEIAKQLSVASELPVEEILFMLEVPANKEMGDFASHASNWLKHCVKHHQ
ncbi:hypothetical protein [Chakrabartyella piscis]|uniref:hypothetical protein n=1 Tax=Chakrabartyella piscis TaxID=2918914 RepID=UPI0029587FB2|nr:hypothetical protein [Chakrabartyella piscis]